MNNLKCKLLKALLGMSLGALGAFVVTFVVYFWNLDMKLTSVMEGILLRALRPDRAQPAPVIPAFFSTRLPRQTGAFAAVFACKQFMKSLDDSDKCPYNA